MIKKERTCAACHRQELCERYDWKGGKITLGMKSTEKGVSIRERHHERSVAGSGGQIGEDLIAPGYAAEGKE